MYWSDQPRAEPGRGAAFPPQTGPDYERRARPPGQGGERAPLPAFKSVKKNPNLAARPETATGVVRHRPERDQLAVAPSYTEPNTPSHSRFASAEDVDQAQTWDDSRDYQQVSPNANQYDLPERPFTASGESRAYARADAMDPSFRRAVSSEEPRYSPSNVNKGSAVFEMPGDIPAEVEGSAPPPFLHRAQTAGPPMGHHMAPLRRQMTEQAYHDGSNGYANLPPSMRAGQQPAGTIRTLPRDASLANVQQPQGSLQGRQYADVFDRGDFGMPSGNVSRQGFNEYGEKSYEGGNRSQNNDFRTRRAPTAPPDSSLMDRSLPVQSPIEPVNPNALPHHPAPVRPGLLNNASASSAKTAPARIPASGPQPTNHPRKGSQPVTLDELNRLRQSNPTDGNAQLKLAKKLVEASKTLADEGGRADTKTTAKNRERYIQEAHKILKKLCASDNPDAMFYLADCYGSGELGLLNDPKESFVLYQSAAKLGHGAAAYRTAVCCEIGPEEGGGTRKDLQKAYQWYKRAASLGDLDATYKMGIILLNGLLSQAKSPGEAIGYLKKAAERADEKNPHALHELGLLYESPDRPGIIIRDDAYALELFSKAAELGFKASQFKLGQAHEYGLLGCPISARNSIVWYTKAAAQGEHQSELALSGWYLTGSDGILEHSDTEAYLWARKAACAEPPLPKAMFAMGYFTEVGIGCPSSIEEAKKWYGRAAGKSKPSFVELY